MLMDEPAFPGCLVQCRPIGVIEGEQIEGGKAERNDRVVAVQAANHEWAHVEHIDDLGKKFVKELQQFFVNYNRLEGKEFRIRDVRGPGQARKCVKKGIEANG